MFEEVLASLQPFAQEFSKRGKQIHLVGGAVRNLLLGRPAQDFDFTTDALPAEVQSYFRKVLPTGLQHGTVTVLFQGAHYEVTTFRVDGEYTDGRRPDGVVFTPSLEEDLKRRDFTINAMALNLNDGELNDPHHGKDDLEAKVLRAIGEPRKRFEEDALRLLRLFRFSSQLGFEVDPATLEAVPPLRHRLAAVSKERIRDELNKAMAGAHPSKAWEALHSLGFLADLFPSLAPVQLSNSALKELDGLPAELRWPFWLTLSSHDRKAWESALRTLTFSNHDIAAALGPAKLWDLSSPTAKAVIEAWGSRDRVGLGVLYLEALAREGYWTDDGLLAELTRAVGSGEPIFLSELAVKGNDLLAVGISGPEVGRRLKMLQRLVWQSPELNSAETLKLRLKEPL